MSLPGLFAGSSSMTSNRSERRLFPMSTKVDRSRPTALSRRIGRTWTAWLGLMMLGLGVRMPAQADPTENGLATPADVIVLVIPTSADTARIGLAFRQHRSTRSVREDIARLSAITGWRIGSKIDVSDESVHPDNMSKYPKTTGAQFTVSQAPQIVNSAPALLPYLRAFQKWNHVEVMFGVPDITPYRGVTFLDTPALRVDLIKEDGVYRYEADIHDHQSTLPALVDTPRPPSTENTSGVPAKAERRVATDPPLWTRVLMILGAGLLCSAGTYLLLSRLSTGRVSARTFRQ